MKVEELPIPDYLKQGLQAMGITSLYPPQEEAVRRGLLKGRNLLIATPTASGKTLLAALAASKHLEQGGKVVYLTPLRAITSEKREFFERLFGERYRVAAVSRDFDQPEEWLKGCHIVVSTNEKMDSMLRHKASWISSVSLVVVDEVHMLSADERGSTLEVVLTRLRREAPSAQLLLLSATIKNVDEIASLANAVPVTSTWRPVPLKEAVYQYDRDELYYADGSSEKIPRLSGDPVKNLVLNTVTGGGQAMVFAGSRRSAESMAVDLAEVLKPLAGSMDELKQLAEKIYDGSDFSSKLSRSIRAGCAFHHAGLSHFQRHVVEKAFRDGLLKAVVATPTLAAGVNIPARTVVIPDVKRAGEEMSVMEYRQLAGRAGRPGYDREGLAVIVANNSRQRSLFMSRYLLGDLEPVYSTLPEQRRLRFHMLGLVSSGVSDNEEIESFISATLGHRQDSALGEKVYSALQYLEAARFIARRDGGWKPTKLGKRVAELYIDPLTARVILSRLDMVEQAGSRTEDACLLTISATPDVETPLHIQPALDWFKDFDDFDGEAMAKATVLKAWVNEMAESTISDRFGAAPGDIYVLSESASWVAQAASEVAAMLGRKNTSKYFLLLSERIKHGVKEELLPLVSIPGVGRVRARALYNAGFRRGEDLVEAGPEKISAIPVIGPATAARLVEAVRNAMA
ncbi:MAG: DEAD/DEAH box helicase [Candidatus Caldarchaeum sp.]